MMDLLWLVPTFPLAGFLVLSLFGARFARFANSRSLLHLWSVFFIQNLYGISRLQRLQALRAKMPYRIDYHYKQSALLAFYLRKLYAVHQYLP